MAERYGGAFFPSDFTCIHVMSVALKCISPNAYDPYKLTLRVTIQAGKP